MWDKTRALVLTIMRFYLYAVFYVLICTSRKTEEDHCQPSLWYKEVVSNIAKLVSTLFFDIKKMGWATASPDVVRCSHCALTID